MVIVHNVKKEIPLTVLEAKIEQKSYQFAVASDSPLGDCLLALDEIKDHIQDILTDLEKKESEKPQQVEA